MSYHTFVEQWVKTFERLGENGLGVKRQGGETSTRGKTSWGDTTSGGNGLGAKQLGF